MRFLHVRSGWAHFRATMAEPFSGRRSSTQFFEPLCVVDPDAGGGGGGGGTGDGGGAGDDKGTGGAGGDGGGTDDAAKKVAEDKRLAAEAAGWRTKLRTTEKEFTDFKTSAETQIEALKAQIAEIQSRGTGDSTPQGDGKGKGTPNPELLQLQRTVKELSDNLRTERETLAKERKQLRDEKIRGKVSELTSEGKFLLPKVFSRLLTDRIDLAGDGALVLKVQNEVGGTDEVPATVENLLKYRPVDDFDSFLPSNGSSGAGSGAGKGKSDDGIDWAKVKANDLDYIAKHITKINAALAQQG